MHGAINSTIGVVLRGVTREDLLELKGDGKFLIMKKAKQAKVEEFVDLFEIFVSVNLDQTTARIEKYKTKRTQLNFIPVRLSEADENAGYSHRFSGRVKVDDLMVVRSPGFLHSPDHIYRAIYCLKEQREAAVNALRASAAEAVTMRLDYAQKLKKSWDTRDQGVQERPDRRTAVPS